MLTCGSSYIVIGDIVQSLVDLKHAMQARREGFAPMPNF